MRELFGEKEFDYLQGFLTLLAEQSHDDDKPRPVTSRACHNV